MIDGRLILPAAGAWAGALVVLTRGAGPALLAAVALFGGLLVGCFAIRRLPSRVAVLTIAAVLSGCVAAALHVTSLSAAPVAEWTESRATATVEAIVTGEPDQRMPSNSPVWKQSSLVDVPIQLRRVTARGQTVEVDLPALMRVGDEADAPRPGSVVTVRGQLSPVFGSSGAVGVITPSIDGFAILALPGWLDGWTHDMRVGLRTALQGTSPEGGALVAGLAIGDESLQSAGLDQAMLRSGLSHLTAVSGGNVAIIVIVITALVTLLRLSILLRVAAAVIALAFFVLLVGPQPSVLRAAVMGAVVLASLLVGGRRAGPSVLAATVLVLVLVSPTLARSWAFALSVFATAGLILLAPHVRAAIDRWSLTRRWPPGLREAIALTVAAQLATLPVLLMMGASVGLVALPANLLAMPAVPAVTILGLCAALVSPVLPGVAHALAVVASLPAAWIAAVAHVGSSSPLATVPWPEGLSGVALLAGVCSAFWLAARARRRWFPVDLPRTLIVTGVVLTAAVSALWLVAPPDRRSWPPPGWFLITCDVGQGDATLIRTGERSAIVIDAGPDADRVDACLSAARIDRIPAVVLTHFHADHVDGLRGVLSGRGVGAVFVSPVAEPPDRVLAVTDTAAAFGLVPVVITAGDERIVDGVRWRALWPRRIIRSGSTPNNASIVLEVAVGGHRILMTGDIERAAQVAVLADLGAVDIVKVPHHGSADEDPRLAAITRPRIALISVGADNDYGHPADSTLESWAATGAIVARTDVGGDIAVVSTATGFAVVERGGTLPK